MELSQKPIRPRWARVVALIMFIAVLGGAAFLIWRMVVTGTEQPEYTISILTLAIAGAIFLIMHLMVVAIPRPEGLYVRNLVHRYTFKWEEIISVRFSADRPWAQLDLWHGEPVSVMAIQSADGEYAIRNAQVLAAWVKTGEAEEPGPRN